MADTKAQATAKQNSKLEHSRGGVTTRDDALDSGVPMLAGDPKEPVGPEDALGAGPKRGDYSEVVGNKQHYRSVPNPDWDEDNPNASPRWVLEHQNPHVADIGDAKAKKGGVDTVDD